jgi:hypothetical protein
MRTGIIASAVLAPHQKKGAKAPQPTDFMPDEDPFMQRPGPKKQSVAEMNAVLLEMAAITKRKSLAKE